MFVEKCLNNGVSYLRLVHNVCCINSKGHRSSRKKVILNIGPLSKFDDGKPDYIQRLKDSFKNGNPLIDSLYPYVDRSPSLETYKVQISEGDVLCVGHPKLYSQILIERILEELGLISLFNRYKAMTNYEFDLIGFFRLLVYGRVLNPSSKIATVSQNNDYYEPIIKDIYEYNVYDTLNFIYDYQNAIINRMNKNLIDKFKRTTNIVYYDVTNFFFEIESPDDDEYDEDGNLISKGLRKNGVCKEERKLPIVQMGLFMDEQGLPISIETFPGNTLDHQTMIDALSNTVDNLNLSKFIFVGDRGMCNGVNIVHLLKRNHGYVISKSIAKTNKKEKDWIFDKSDYFEESKAFKYKSINRRRNIHIPNTDEVYSYTEKVVTFWSKNFYDKQVVENKSFLEFIDKLQKSPTSFRLSRTQSKDIKRFLKKDVVNDKTGEILNSNDLKSLIDFDKINQFKDQMGYYQIVTSELNLSDKEIIDIYHKLSRIEDQFRIMKGDLDTRPIYVRTTQHIKSHLLICMIALTVMRIIQNKIVAYNKQIKPNKIEVKNWEMGLTGERVQKALNKWMVEEYSDNLYRFNNTDDLDLKLILDSFEITIPTKLFRKGELKSLKTSIEVYK